MINEWIANYNPKNLSQAQAALREIMQEVALAGLYRAGFFEKAAFYGGTALRIFHKLDRFSEDLDFSLLKPEKHFRLSTYLNAMHAEFEALGMQVSITDKPKKVKSQVESAFLKSETVWKELILKGMLPQVGGAITTRASVKIKIEIDVDPPLGFETEEKLLLRPFSFYVKCFTLPCLFAGKVHAFLFRKWKTNVKGRDWYDLEWYIRNNIPMHFDHFVKRAQNSGDLPEGEFTEKKFFELLHHRIDTVSMDKVKADIERFIPDSKRLVTWSPTYFHDLVGQLKID